MSHYPVSHQPECSVLLSNHNYWFTQEKTPLCLRVGGDGMVWSPLSGVAMRMIARNSGHSSGRTREGGRAVEGGKSGTPGYLFGQQNALIILMKTVDQMGQNIAKGSGSKQENLKNRNKKSFCQTSWTGFG